jgi:hypothetical protein
MATVIDYKDPQSMTEKRQYDCDFTNDLATVSTTRTVTGGTVTHIPPAGGTVLSPTVTASTPYVLTVLTHPDIVGTHILRVLATYSDGQSGEIYLRIRVNF